MRTKTLVIAGAVAMLAVFAQTAAASHSSTQPYTASMGLALSGEVYGESFNIGTMEFSNLQGEVPVQATFADATGGPVPFAVCQDLDDDGTCGETNNPDGRDEPDVLGCATSADLSEPSGGDWDPDVDVDVYLPTVSIITPTCGVGTTGSVTMSFAAPE